MTSRRDTIFSAGAQGRLFSGLREHPRSKTYRDCHKRPEFSGLLATTEFLRRESKIRTLLLVNFVARNTTLAETDIAHDKFLHRCESRPKIAKNHRLFCENKQIFRRRHQGMFSPTKT